LYSTFIGGNADDFAYAIAVDSDGAAYIGGQTFSSDYPVTSGAFRTTFNNCIDAFVTKLSPDGSRLIYSTYLTGLSRRAARGCFPNINNNFVLNLAVDGQGHAYIVGGTGSTAFPVTAGAFQTTFPDTVNFSSLSGFVIKLQPDGSGPVYSTFL